MGINVGSNYYNISCDYCSDSKTIDYHDYDKMMKVEQAKGWFKNQFSGNCTCPNCRKKQENKLTNKEQNYGR